MENYTVFAYFTMFFMLFLLLRNVLQIYFWLKSANSDFCSMELKLKGRKWRELRHHTLVKGTTPITKQELIETVFAPVISKLKLTELFSSIAPTAGMFFTLTSFILAAQSFSEGGSVQTMFKAVAVGMGTTAVAAFIMILTKLLLTRAENSLNLLLNKACGISSDWHKKLSELRRANQLKRVDS